MEVNEIKNAVKKSGGNYEAWILENGGVNIMDYNGEEIDYFESIEKASYEYIIF